MDQTGTSRMLAHAASRPFTTARPIFRASFADPHVTRTTILSVMTGVTLGTRSTTPLARQDTIPLRDKPDHPLRDIGLARHHRRGLYVSGRAPRRGGDCRAHA